MKTEYDVSEIAWQAYQLMYEYFFKNGQFIEKKRPYLDYRYTNKAKNYEISLSGDTDFNYTKGFAYSRLQTYQKLVDTVPKEYAKMYSNNLEIFRQLTYSIVNISLIPRTGNMQSVKQGIGNDRLDTFVWVLNLYYNDKICLFLNHSSYANIDTLKSYYDLFNDVYDYCDRVYHINESLVDDLIESGKKPIDSPERIFEFMKLTIRFWNQKARYIRIQADSKECGKIIEALDDYEEKINQLYSG